MSEAATLATRSMSSKTYFYCLNWILISGVCNKFQYFSITTCNNYLFIFQKLRLLKFKIMYLSPH